VLLVRAPTGLPVIRSSVTVRVVHRRGDSREINSALSMVTDGTALSAALLYRGWVGRLPGSVRLPAERTVDSRRRAACRCTGDHRALEGRSTVAARARRLRIPIEALNIGFDRGRTSAAVVQRQQESHSEIATSWVEASGAELHGFRGPGQARGSSSSTCVALLLAPSSTARPGWLCVEGALE